MGFDHFSLRFPIFISQNIILLCNISKYLLLCITYYVFMYVHMDRSKCEHISRIKMAEEEADFDEEVRDTRKGRGFDDEGRKPQRSDRGGIFERGVVESKGNASKCK